jgi:hypothetical protein
MALPLFLSARGTDAGSLIPGTAGQITVRWHDSRTAVRAGPRVADVLRAGPDHGFPYLSSRPKQLPARGPFIDLRTWPHVVVSGEFDDVRFGPVGVHHCLRHARYLVQRGFDSCQLITECFRLPNYPPESLQEP